VGVLAAAIKGLTFGKGVLDKTEQPFVEYVVKKAAIGRGEVLTLVQFSSVIDQILDLDIVSSTVFDGTLI